MADTTVDCQTIHVAVDFNQPVKFVGKSVEDGQPIAVPLNNLEELLAWEANDPKDCGQKFSVSSVPHISKLNKESSTMTLVCHDMKGGYLADRFVQGQKGEGTLGYTMKYWNMIDTFVYFSHHFITIPPVGWINAAHRNGVTVLGTFITEGNEGYVRCKSILTSPSVWKTVVDKLVEIASYYKFDGWFINIENEIQPGKISDLVEFLRYLTKRMHEVDEKSLIIWYDSVINDGTLQWQNELNEKNRLFYEVCDGIFLNYWWREANLITSKQHTRAPCNVYAGIDVFGRGTFGGGGYNAVTALSVIRKYNLSAAIFAPGWVHEDLDVENFDQNNKRFWKTLQPLCVSRSLNAQHGLTTQFNPGYGKTNENAGGDISGALHTWYHISSQHTMPLIPNDEFVLISKGSCYYLRVLPVGKKKRNIVKAKDLQCVCIFDLKMCVKESGVVLSVDKPCEKSIFVLMTDIGLCELKPDWTYNGFHVNKVVRDNFVHVCVTNDKPFRIQSLSIQQTLEHQDVGLIQLLSGGLPPSSEVATTTIECVEIDWSKSGSKDKFKLGCTLIFHGVPEGTCATEVSYQSLNREANDAKVIKRVIGMAYLPCFRVHELVVVNPQYFGPDCWVLFEAHYLSGIGKVLGKGRLKVFYCENN